MNKESNTALNKEPSEEQNKAPNEGEARVLSDDELKGIVGGARSIACSGGAGFVDDRQNLIFEGFGDTAKTQGAVPSKFVSSPNFR